MGNIGAELQIRKVYGSKCKYEKFDGQNVNIKSRGAKSQILERPGPLLLHRLPPATVLGALVSRSSGPGLVVLLVLVVAARESPSGADGGARFRPGFHESSWVSVVSRAREGILPSLGGDIILDGPKVWIPQRLRSSRHGPPLPLGSWPSVTCVYAQPATMEHFLLTQTVLVPCCARSNRALLSMRSWCHSTSSHIGMCSGACCMGGWRCELGSPTS
ncbi:hypothetical protein VNO77_41617 [Canavalia gladiata]|uniref:Uncharacterized protein n=1 Tax=Canavalia gladiata TaxID=3824 RepID=A0AAN9PRZ4_CANGL